MIEELIDEYKKFKKIEDKYNHLLVDKKQMADKLYEYALKEWESKDKEQIKKEYIENCCKDCRYYCFNDNCKKYKTNCEKEIIKDLGKPIRLDTDYFPGTTTCGSFEWD